jgi:hypothetical protein
VPTMIEIYWADLTVRCNTFNRKVAMKVHKRASDQCTRTKMVSPGRPPLWQRDNLYRFWQAIAKGRTSEEAAVDAGVSSPVGVRWLGEREGCV